MNSNIATPPTYPKEHPASELLFRHLLEDSQTRIGLRNADATWTYERVIPFPIVGFNPLRNNVYLNFNAELTKALADPSLLACNPEYANDLAQESLFTQHDYLHNWAVQAIHHLMPELGYGITPITRKNFEDRVFCHILTETMAVVGLDYWYLSLLPKRRYFVVAYCEKDLPGFQKVIPDLTVQEPYFFDRLLTTYCQGYFPGFTNENAHKDPFLFRWLTHELGYAIKQRRYTRLWLAYLASEPISLADADEKAPIKMDKPWMVGLAEQLKTMLWEKIKENVQHSFNRKIDPTATWQADREKYADYRFVNINCDSNLPQDEETFSSLPPRCIPILFYQLISAYEFGSFTPEQVNAIKTIAINDRKSWQDFSALQNLLAKGNKLSARCEEPRDLFIIN